MDVRRRSHEVRVAWAPSRVRRVVRHRGLWVALVLIGVIFGAASLSARIVALAAERDSWGETRRVVVVTEPIEAGGELTGAFELRSLPRSVIPAATLDQVPPGSRAKVALVPGEILLAHRVTGEHSTGLAPGMAALTLLVTTQVPLISEGDLVDVWMIDSVNLSSRRIAEHVVVLALSDRDITIAIAADDIAEAAAASLRPVTITLVG